VCVCGDCVWFYGCQMRGVDRLDRGMYVRTQTNTRNNKEEKKKKKGNSNARKKKEEKKRETQKNEMKEDRWWRNGHCLL